MFKKISYAVYALICIVLLGIYMLLGHYNNSLGEQKEMLITKQKETEKQIDSILKGQTVSNLNQSYSLLVDYMDKRQQLTFVELLIFLEYVYPMDNFVDSISLSGSSSKDISMDFYSNSTENIRRLYRNLDWLQGSKLISSYEINPFDKKEQIQMNNGEKTKLQFYQLKFSVEPNYSLIRQFILDHNDKLRIPFEQYFILLPENISKYIQDYKTSGGTGDVAPVKNGNGVKSNNTGDIQSDSLTGVMETGSNSLNTSGDTTVQNSATTSTNK